MKIFLDTNVLAAALATRGLCAELFELVLQSHELLISDSIIQELERILPEKLGQSESVTSGFIALLNSEAVLAAAKHHSPSLPDPDDEPHIAAALAAKADVFVTGDKALANLHNIEGLPIVSPRGLWEMLSGRK